MNEYIKSNKEPSNICNICSNIYDNKKDIGIINLNTNHKTFININEFSKNFKLESNKSTTSVLKGFNTGNITHYSNNTDNPHLNNIKNKSTLINLPKHIIYSLMVNENVKKMRKAAFFYVINKIEELKQKALKLYKNKLYRKCLEYYYEVRLHYI